MRANLVRNAIAVVALTLATLGCGNGPASSGAGGFGRRAPAWRAAAAAAAAGARPERGDEPCPPAMRVGGFSVELFLMPGDPGYTNVTGGVREAIDPRQVWTGATNAPGCALVPAPRSRARQPASRPVLRRQQYMHRRSRRA